MKEYIVQAIVQETIDSFDAHNAPELVQCNDCKHGKRVTNAKGEYMVDCLLADNWLKHTNWYCADGEKR